MSKIQYVLFSVLALSSTAFAYDSCPAGFPLNCGNGECCPAGSTLYCPQLAPTPCLNPDRLTPQQLKLVSENCHPLLSCN